MKSHPLMEARGSIWYPPQERGGNIGYQLHQLHQPLMQPPPMIDLRVMRDVVQELYEPDLRQIGCPDYYKPYSNMVDWENPYPRGYIIPDFSIFSREDGWFTLEHVERFIVRYGELVNYDNFSYFKLRLFPNSLTISAFSWYTTLPRNSILSWHEWRDTSIPSSLRLNLKCALQNHQGWLREVGRLLICSSPD